MRNFRLIAFVLIICVGCIANRSAAAFYGRCTLIVDGRTFLNGRCNIDMQPDGSFSIGVAETNPSRYFAYVNLQSDGTALGSWNGVDAESHAGESLGTLTRKGACWFNSRAKVCAVR